MTSDKESILYLNEWFYPSGLSIMRHIMQYPLFHSEVNQTFPWCRRAPSGSSEVCSAGYGRLSPLLIPLLGVGKGLDSRSRPGAVCPGNVGNTTQLAPFHFQPVPREAG